MEYIDKEDGDYKENVMPGSTSKGMFRDPLHATLKRQKYFRGKVRWKRMSSFWTSQRKGGCQGQPEFEAL